MKMRHPILSRLCMYARLCLRLCNCFHTRPVAPPSILWLRQVAHRSQRRHVPVRVLVNFSVREACVTFINCSNSGVPVVRSFCHQCQKISQKIRRHTPPPRGLPESGIWHHLFCSSDARRITMPLCIGATHAALCGGQ